MVAKHDSIATGKGLERLEFSLRNTFPICRPLLPNSMMICYQKPPMIPLVNTCKIINILFGSICSAVFYVDVIQVHSVGEPRRAPAS
jgi:hypothetical protein